MRNNSLNFLTQILSKSYKILLLLGLVFIGFALLILAYPELLAIPVSFLLFVIGVYLFRGAWRAWQAKRKSKEGIKKFFNF